MWADNIIHASMFEDFTSAFACVSAAGGILVVTAEYDFAEPITLPPNVEIDCRGAGILNWTGSTGAALIETPSTDVYRNKRLRLRINSNSHPGEIVRIHSAYDFDLDIYHTGFWSTSTLLHLSADSTAGGDGYSKRNIAYGRIRVRSEGTVGTLVKTSGVDPGGGTYGGSAQVVTLCKFDSLSGHDQYVKGIDLVSWTDNNTFSGSTRLGGSSSDDYIGVDIGSGAGSGVYSNVIENMAVDTFGTQTGRAGVRFRANTKNNEVRAFHQDPVAEGGAVVVDDGCMSYYVRRALGGVLNEESRGLTDNYTTLPDDTALGISLGGGASGHRAAHVHIVGNDAIANGLFYVRVGPSPVCSEIWRGNTTYFEYGTGAALNGTTGADSRVTLRASGDGKVYLENRLGYPIKVSMEIKGVVGL